LKTKSASYLYSLYLCRFKEIFSLDSYETAPLSPEWRTMLVVICLPQLFAIIIVCRQSACRAHASRYTRMQRRQQMPPDAPVNSTEEKATVHCRSYIIGSLVSKTQPR
jgi:hypothetical protein